MLNKSSFSHKWINKKIKKKNTYIIYKNLTRPKILAFFMFLKEKKSTSLIYIASWSDFFFQYDKNKNIGDYILDLLGYSKQTFFFQCLICMLSRRIPQQKIIYWRCPCSLWHRRCLQKTSQINHVKPVENNAMLISKEAQLRVRVYLTVTIHTNDQPACAQHSSDSVQLLKTEWYVELLGVTNQQTAESDQLYLSSYFMSITSMFE